jgi:hypothetical protein
MLGNLGKDIKLIETRRTDMYQLTDITPPEMIPKTRFIATRGSTHLPVSRQTDITVDAWARHACAANGFGDAGGMQPHSSRTETSQYAYTRSGEQPCQ